MVDRRTVLQCAGAAVASGVLSACGSSGQRPSIRFGANKRETVTYFSKITANFNASQSAVGVRFENNDNTRVIADFVRNSPVHVGINNFDYPFGGYVQRGVLADQRSTPALKTIRPDLLDLVQTYGTFRGQVSAIPYSVTGQGVIYNREIFDRAGVSVPKTWDGFLDVCERLRGKGITPLMGTFADDWTLGQGLFNFSVIGMVDVARFFSDINAVGEALSPDSPESFSRNFREPMRKAKKLLPFHNTNAKALLYDQGNREFAAGKAAMLLQGPWAYAGILGANPKFKGGMFPLPMTNDPSETRAAMNLDQVVWTPSSATGAEREGGLAMVEYLLQPKVLHRYNDDNLAFSPDKDAPEQKSPLVSDLNPYILGDKYRQGPELYIPAAIPVRRYFQEYLYGGDLDTLLGKLDRDWQRLAIRLSA